MITAMNAANYGLKRIVLAMRIQEQAYPIVDYPDESMVVIMRIQSLKYQLQSGRITPASWKKKLEKTFRIESLTTEEPSHYRLLNQNIKEVEWKKEAVFVSFELIMGDIEIVKEALIQIHELKKTKLESEQQLMDDPNIDIEDLLQRQKDLEERMIKEQDWKFASYNVPLEIHIQFIMF